MTIGERIKVLRKEKNLSMEDFGSVIGMGKSAVSRIENGFNGTTDQTIRSICREFGVNEQWLRTGEGEMKQKLTRNQEIAEFMATVMRDPDDAPRKRFISIVSKLDIEEWQLLEAIAKKWTEDE